MNNSNNGGCFEWMDVYNRYNQARNRQTQPSKGLVNTYYRDNDSVI